MTKAERTEQLTALGFKTVSVVVLKECEADTDRFGNPFFERDRQLHIWRGRLRGIELYDPRNPLRTLVQESIAALEAIPPDTPIYYWDCEIDGRMRSGRSSPNGVLQIFPGSAK